MITLTVICAVATIALVVAEHRRAMTVRTISKLIASSSFVAMGLIVLPDIQTEHRYALTIVVGLVLGAIGDLCLLGNSRKAFMAGLVVFLAGHIAYVVAAAGRLPITEWPAAAGVLGLVPLAAGGIALAWLWRFLGDLRIPVIVYLATIVVMVIAAIALWRTGSLPTPQRTRFLVGAVLFFTSDIAVARHKFVAPGVINQTWGLPAYFAGQVFIAWSLVGL